MSYIKLLTSERRPRRDTSNHVETCPRSIRTCHVACPKRVQEVSMAHTQLKLLQNMSCGLSNTCPRRIQGTYAFMSKKCPCPILLRHGHNILSDVYIAISSVSSIDSDFLSLIMITKFGRYPLYSSTVACFLRVLTWDQVLIPFAKQQSSYLYSQRNLQSAKKKSNCLLTAGSEVL